MNDWYAHSSDSDATESWQPLAEHLRNVADQAGEFASVFGFERWGYTLGLLHDIGKATPAFQRRLHGSSEPVDHSTPGARIAFERYSITEGIEGALLAYALAGHHGGIPNGSVREGSERAPLTERFAREDVQGGSSYQFLDALVDMGLTLPEASELEPIDIQARFEDDGKRGCSQKAAREQVAFALSVLCRMLFSCLVDADYLDTERFMTPSEAEARLANTYDSIDALSAMLDTYLDHLMLRASDTPVNRVRAAILHDCRNAAALDRGLFTLTVPTGGGKTLSVMAFSLRHALEHGFSRIIYASPFTSITSQTAGVFRSVFGEENVLEHHSNVDFAQLGDERERQYRLAIQNWDAPIIVTTNVQLLESLYSNKPAACRKLHNIANSIVILDEAQTLPDGLLVPTLAMLEELTIDYGVSVVLCTATQPALDGRWPFNAQPREIAWHREGFDEAFGGRVRFEYLCRVAEDALAEDLAALNQVLCIVGTKAKARRLYQAVRSLVCEGTCSGESSCDLGVYHLSANMTPLHRSERLREISARLLDGSRCIVISTQLIEAGVDVDFPNVYRELAGIDSLFQAAGRCNREGRRSEGVVRVFELDDSTEVQGKTVVSGVTAPLARTWLERMKAIARMLIEEHGGVIDESLVVPFFGERYGATAKQLDAREIYRMLSSRQLPCSGYRTLQLETVARRYKIIDNSAKTIFVPWGEAGRELYERLVRLSEFGDSPASMANLLQRSSISVRTDVYDALVNDGVVDAETYAPISVLHPEYGCSTFYSDDVGLLEPGEEEQNELIF